MTRSPATGLAQKEWWAPLLKVTVRPGPELGFSR